MSWVLSVLFVGYTMLGIGFIARSNHKVTPQAAESPTMSARYKIGVIDTGFKLSRDTERVRICSDGHYDFKADLPVIAQYHPHGSAVAGVLAESLSGIDYCLIIMQVFSGAEGGDKSIEMYSVAQAVDKLRETGVVAINVSLTGKEYSYEEYQAIYLAGKEGIKVFVAAGNDHRDLDEYCNYYPGCYEIDNLVVVGAIDENLKYPASYSNYGSMIKRWYRGFFNIGGHKWEGTSFAAPRALASYVRSLDYQRRKLKTPTKTR